MLAAALVLAAPAAAQQRARVADAPTRIEVTARPIGSFDSRDASRAQFGALSFRGGLELSSPAKDFGGISAIRVGRDGAGIIAITDKGRWLRGRIVYEGDRPTGLADVELAPMLGSDGRALQRRGWFDTESLAQDGGTLFVGIERANQIVRFDYGRDGLAARGRPIAVPPEFRSLPFNQGIEGLVHVARGPLAGTLIALSERALDVDGNIRGFLIGGRSPGTFSVRRSGDYDITDAALLPDGDLLVLERRFSVWRGVGARIRRVSIATVVPGALVDGPVLFEADLSYQIDNMEGLAVHQTPAGDVVLTLVSDDNFSTLQRTLLLQFKLVQP